MLVCVIENSQQLLEKCKSFHFVTSNYQMYNYYFSVCLIWKKNEIVKIFLFAGKMTH